MDELSLKFKNIGLSSFLEQYPNMVIAPDLSPDIVLRGNFEFEAKFKESPTIKDSYDLEIRIPKLFPLDIPTIKELRGKIPRDGHHHINSSDDTLCLGSPLRLKMIALEEKCMLGFVQRCLIPYLYWISTGQFSSGELAHGREGLLTDYMELFNVTSKEMVVPFLKFLTTRKRISNKKLCMCGCLKRIGRCPNKTNLSINKFRKISTRSWCKQHLKILE